MESYGGVAPAGVGLPEMVIMEYLKAAIKDLNDLDDQLQAYDPSRLDDIGAKVNEYVASLKRVQEGRNHLTGEVPIPLIERVERENLNPLVYTMEELERGKAGIQGLERREQSIQVLQDTIARGSAPPNLPVEAGILAPPFGTGAVPQRLPQSNPTTTGVDAMDVVASSAP